MEIVDLNLAKSPVPLTKFTKSGFKQFDRLIVFLNDTFFKEIAIMKQHKLPSMGYM